MQSSLAEVRKGDEPKLQGHLNFSLARLWILNRVNVFLFQLCSFEMKHYEQPPYSRTNLALKALSSYIAKELKEDIFVFQICYFMTYGCCRVSLCTITAISLDRLTALHYHIRYVTMVTSTQVVYTLVTVWLAIFLGFSISLWSIYIYVICVSVVIGIC